MVVPMLPSHYIFGHLRSSIIGKFLKIIAKLTGRKVITDMHFGDWGLQMGLNIYELRLMCPDYKFFLQNDELKDTYLTIDYFSSLTLDLLNEVYQLASKKSKESRDYRVAA